MSQTSAAAKALPQFSWRKAFPNSRFFGFDYHDKSIEAAREYARRNGLSDRVTFEVSKRKRVSRQRLRSRGSVRLFA